MKLADLIKELSLEVKSCKNDLEKDVTGGYTSDLLSDVLANASQDSIWITLQTHPNIVAIASVKGLAGVIIVGGKQPQEETLKKAEAEKVMIMTSDRYSFEVAGKMYQLLK